MRQVCAWVRGEWSLTALAGRRQNLHRSTAEGGRNAEWGGKRFRKQAIPMDFLWSTYGIRMECLWNNTGAASYQHPTNTLARRDAVRDLELFQILTSGEAGLGSA